MEVKVMQLNMFSSCQLEELMDTGPVSVSGNWLYGCSIFFSSAPFGLFD